MSVGTDMTDPTRAVNAVSASGAATGPEAAPADARPVDGTSHVIGDSSLPFPAGTIGAALHNAALQWPDRDALVSVEQNRHLSWAALDRAATALAAGLVAHGLRRGDRVGLWAMNAAEWVIAQYAVARAGMILVTINPAGRVPELRHVLATTGCAAIIVGPPHKHSDYAAMLAEAVAQTPDDSMPRLAIQFGAPSRFGATAWDHVLACATPADHAQLAKDADLVRDTDPVNIQFTSGTTGQPKGVTLSHRNILANGWFTGQAMGFAATDRLCLPVPLYHCFGMVTGVLACLGHGVAMVLPSAGFDAGATLRAIASEGCTALYGVPTMYTAMFAHPDFDSTRLESLRTGIMAGTLCPPGLMQSAIDRMHMRDIAICYGMTEAPVSFQTSLDDPIQLRLETVGRIQPHIEAKLIGENGATVPRGAAGEVCVRGYNTMAGYWQDPPATADAIDAEGWMHTGDLGTIDAGGYLRIVGRLKDMVIRGGENLYPKEIETFLLNHPAIADVQVFGVADAVFGEELSAWIIARPGYTLDETAIRAFCAGRIAHHKVPRHIRFVEAFPMTVTGKVRKAELRALMERELTGPN